MPGLPAQFLERAAAVVEDAAASPSEQPDKTIQIPSLVARAVLPPFNSSTAPQGLLDAVKKDPWSQSDKYSRGWVYFSVILLALAMGARLYHLWSDKVRTAQHKGKNPDSPVFLASPETPYEMSYLDTDRSTNKLFPRENALQLDPDELQQESTLSSFKPAHDLYALIRYIFYRPTPVITVYKRWRPISFPSLAVMAISFAALAFVAIYCFLPQPLYWESIRFGSPPLAVRSGMISVAMLPWLVALSMKANLISYLTGIGHERLNVLHRWGGWICLFLALVHTVPFYVTPVWDKGGYKVFHTYFSTGYYIYGTG